MSLLVDLKHMLDNANRLLVAQQSVMEQTQFTAVVASLHDSILAKIAGLPSVSIAEYHELAGIIGMTVFSVAQKAKLNTVLTSRCLSALQGLGDMPAAASKQQTQGCNYPSVFLTHHDWHTMDDPHKSAMQKISTVVNRFRLLGLTNPTEMAYKHLAALVIATHCAGSTPEQMYNIVVELKNAFGARRKESPPCFRMAEFPDSPSFLPATVASSGYPDPHDRHADRCIDGLAEILATIPLRLSNRCLRPAAKGVASAAAESHVDAMTSGVIAQVLSHLGMNMGGHAGPETRPFDYLSEQARRTAASPAAAAAASARFHRLNAIPTCHHRHANTYTCRCTHACIAHWPGWRHGRCCRGCIATSPSIAPGRIFRQRVSISSTRRDRRCCRSCGGCRSCRGGACGRMWRREETRKNCGSDGSDRGRTAKA